MSEFTLHHHVTELMNSLSVKRSHPIGAEEYTDKLLKSRTPYITTQVSSNQAKKKIAHSTTTPLEFLEKYDELKMKNVRELDPLVDLLARLDDATETKEFLSKHAHNKAKREGMTLEPHSNITSKLPASGTTMTNEQVSELRATLLKSMKKIENPPADILQVVQTETQPKRNVNLPPQPDWMYDRQHLTDDFVTSFTHPDVNVVRLDTLPVFSQEYLVMKDVLVLLRGISGDYITARPLSEKYAKREFLIDQTMDSSLHDFVKGILPLCSDYCTIVRFIEEKSSFEYGLVNNALAEAMSSFINDYFILVAQLEDNMETGELTLPKLCFYLQPTITAAGVLASIANSINKGKCIGGSVLSLLHEKTASMIGDPKSTELCLFLAQSASVPYLEILENWIYRGIINDPYEEFLVEENEAIVKEKLQEDYNNAYWEKRYTVHRERIPVFLEQVADKILNTGKYLNVVRGCGRDVKCPTAETLVYSLQERHYDEHIQAAYSYASQLLLNLLMEEKELMTRLRSIKHYFLMDKGDFVVQFMDMTETEMKQNIADILPFRLESLLELALRTSTANEDRFKDDLRVELLPFDLTSQLLQILAIDSNKEKEYHVDPTDIRLSGLESFSFDYVVKWPVSLVLSRKALTRYQILFRHLFYCKHVERQLCSVWIIHKQTKALDPSSCGLYKSAFALRQRMLNFVQNFEYYMMFEVIEPNWQTFQQNLTKVTNVDDVLSSHWDFLDSCLNDCMLTSPQLLRIVHKILVVCVTFSNYVQRISKSTSMESETERLRDSSLQPSMTNKERKEDAQKKKTASKVLSEHVNQVLTDENFEETVATFDANFTRYLLELLAKIRDENTKNYEQKLYNIIYRLDFNGYYTEQIVAVSTERAFTDSTASVASSSTSYSSGSGRSLTSFTNQQPATARYVPGQYDKKSKGAKP